MEKEKEVVVEKELTELHLEQINELKSKMDSMVDPEEYKKLKQQYETLLNDYVNKRPVNQPKVEKLNPKDYADRLLQATGDNMTNREYWDNALKYRDAVLEQRGIDVFGHNGEESKDSQEVANIVKQLLNESQNDTDFRIRMENTLKDDPAVLQALRAKK